MDLQYHSYMDKVIDPADTVNNMQNYATLSYQTRLALFIEEMYIKNSKTDTYVYIERDEIDTIMETLLQLPQEDITILTSFTNDMTM